MSRHMSCALSPSKIRYKGALKASSSVARIMLTGRDRLMAQQTDPQNRPRRSVGRGAISVCVRRVGTSAAGPESLRLYDRAFVTLKENE
jgi:hypothetical protein